MDRPTIDIYEQRAADWERARSHHRLADAEAFARRVGPGLRLDAGCGPGRYTSSLQGPSGAPVVALDAARAMLGLAAGHAPGALLLQADLARLPFRDRSLHGAWARMSYQHLPKHELPLALAHLHWALRPGAPVEIVVLAGDYQGSALPGDDFPGRYFAAWKVDEVSDVLAGAGFLVDEAGASGDRLRVVARRDRSLPDTVGAGMRLLVCGLNPSLYSADRGVPFARPGNRFWPAAVAAGIVSRPWDPRHALAAHGVGMSDLVKRATSRAADLDAAEYAAGIERIRRLVARLQPAVVCFVGLAGWRAAVDRRARPGVQPERLAGAPVYVMPSTSGLNARVSPAELAEHLRAAAAAGGGSRPVS